MAWIFSLSAETGPDRTNAQRFERHFAGRRIGTDLGEYNVWTNVAGYDGAYWCFVGTDQLSRTGIYSVEDALAMSLVGVELYALLRSAPSFRYALVGVEVDAWVTEAEMREDPAFITKMDGFVIERELYKEVGAKGNFQDFTASHVWLPYRGESHRWYNAGTQSFEEWHFEKD